MKRNQNMLNTLPEKQDSDSLLPKRKANVQLIKFKISVRQIKILQVNYFQSRFARMYSQTPSSKTTGATTACKTSKNRWDSLKVRRDKTYCALKGELKVNSERWLAFTTKWSTLNAAIRTRWPLNKLTWIQIQIQIRIKIQTQVKTSFNLNRRRGLHGMRQLTQ